MSVNNVKIYNTIDVYRIKWPNISRISDLRFVLWSEKMSGVFCVGKLEKSKIINFN